MPSREAVSPTLWRYLAPAFSPASAAMYDPELPIRRITAVLQGDGIPYLDLLPALRDAAARTGSTGFYDYDPHLNEEGHARVAEALAPFLAALVADRRDGAAPP
jgi:hypothetical protein